jgi:hypothetical protein
MLSRQAAQKCVGKGLSRHRGLPRVTLSRVEVYLPGKIHLTVKKGTAADVISLISTYAERGGR